MFVVNIKKCDRRKEFFESAKYKKLKKYKNCASLTFQN